MQNWLFHCKGRKPLMLEHPCPLNTYLQSSQHLQAWVSAAKINHSFDDINTELPLLCAAAESLQPLETNKTAVNVQQDFSYHQFFCSRLTTSSPNKNPFQKRTSNRFQIWILKVKSFSKESMNAFVEKDRFVKTSQLNLKTAPSGPPSWNHQTWFLVSKTVAEISERQDVEPWSKLIPIK